MSDRRQVHLIRPARERWYECDPVLILEHGARGATLAFENVAVQAPSCLAPVPRLGRQLALDDRRYERIGVDLSVWMTERHADHLASVLEDEDVADVGQTAELVRSISPDLDEVSDVIDTLLAERGVVDRRVAHNLAPPLVAGIRGEGVFELVNALV